MLQLFTMGEPIQIISFDGDRKLKLNKVELEKIMSQEGLQGLPIAVLSVVGAFRTGKSSLLNWMERFLSSSVKVNHFSLIIQLFMNHLFCFYRAPAGLHKAFPIMIMNQL